MIRKKTPKEILQSAAKATAKDEVPHLIKVKFTVENGQTVNFALILDENGINDMLKQLNESQIDEVIESILKENKNIETEEELTDTESDSVSGKYHYCQHYDITTDEAEMLGWYHQKNNYQPVYLDGFLEGYLNDVYDSTTLSADEAILVDNYRRIVGKKEK